MNVNHDTIFITFKHCTLKSSEHDILSYMVPPAVARRKTDIRTDRLDNLQYRVETRSFWVQEMKL